MIEIKFNYNISLDEGLASVASGIYLHKINLTYDNFLFKKSNWGEVKTQMQNDFSEKSFVILKLERDNYFLECKVIKGENGLVLNLSPNTEAIKANEALDLRPYIRIALDLCIYAEILEMKVIGRRTYQNASAINTM